MRRGPLLVLSAVGEAGTGGLLLAVPSVVLRLLLGIESAGDEVTIVSRLAGAALVAIGVACWEARRDRNSPAASGIIAALLVYDLGAAALLAYAGTALDLSGIALWPAVVLHAVLAAWCIACLVRPGN